MAMYKTRNTGTGNRMQGTRGIRGMLYSGECRQTFREMSPDIPGNVLKHSKDIPGNVVKYYGECRQTFRGISSKNPENIRK